MNSILITILYVMALMYLYIKFPLIMFSFLLGFLALMWFLIEISPYDYELWPDLYKKTSLF